LVDIPSFSISELINLDYHRYSKIFDRETWNIDEKLRISVDIPSFYLNFDYHWYSKFLDRYSNWSFSIDIPRFSTDIPSFSIKKLGISMKTWNLGRYSKFFNFWFDKLGLSLIFQVSWSIFQDFRSRNLEFQWTTWNLGRYSKFFNFWFDKLWLSLIFQVSWLIFQVSRSIFQDF
jgi:hypothetical protein